MSTARPMTAPERQFLQDLLRSAPGKARRRKEGAENALILFALLMLLFVVGWWVINWVSKAALNRDIGLNSPAAIWILSLGVLGCAAGAVVSTARWIRGWKDNRPSLNADLEGGRVIEEHYRFTAAKRFQEPEHGGLLYFLRTSDDKVLVLYDADSQDFGAQGQDPLKSSFKPCAELSIVRAPKTGFVISRHFSGAPLAAGERRELALRPKDWPDSDQYSTIPWSELDARLSKST